MPTNYSHVSVSNEQVADNLLKTAEHAKKHPRKIYGVAPYGFPSLDEVTGGIGEDHMIVLAARPNIGKSALAGQIARTVAEYFLANNIDAWVKIASYEMSAESYLNRVACGAANISSLALRRGEVDDVGFERYKKVLDLLSKLPIEYTTASSTFQEFTDFVVGGRPCGIWILDHVGLLSDITSAGQSQYTAQVGVANKMQNLCGNGYPGICVAHMNRSSDSNKDSRPSLSNLAGADNFGRNANVVLSLYRPNVALNIPDDLKGGPEPAYIDVLKNKDGPLKEIKTLWVPSRTMFVEDAEVAQPVQPVSHMHPSMKTRIEAV